MAAHAASNAVTGGATVWCNCGSSDRSPHHCLGHPTESGASCRHVTSWESHFCQGHLFFTNKQGAAWLRNAIAAINQQRASGINAFNMDKLPSIRPRRGESSADPGLGLLPPIAVPQHLRPTSVNRLQRHRQQRPRPSPSPSPDRTAPARRSTFHPPATNGEPRPTRREHPVLHIVERDIAAAQRAAAAAAAPRAAAASEEPAAELAIDDDAILADCPGGLFEDLI
jgi:hypothetical protein